MSDDVLGNVREAFQGKRGKILLVGGALAVAGYVWWSRSNGTTTTDPTDGTDSTTPETGGGRGQSDPTVGNTTTNDKTRATNNAEWLADATDYLKGRGVAAGAAYSALTKALAGQKLTTAEAAWVSQAIAGVGVPPEGMPPLTSSPATSVTKPGAISGRKTTVNHTKVMTAFKGAPRATGYEVLVDGKPTRTITGSPFSMNLAPGRHTIGIRAKNSAGYGPTSNTIVTTKK